MLRAHCPRTAFAILLLNASLACAQLASTPLAKPSTATSATLFASLPPAETGVDMVQKLDLKHPLKRLYYGHACGGVAIGDFNGDQLPDLYLANGAAANRLYLQMPSKDGALTFRDATEETETSGGDRWGIGVSLVDIDADGDLDLYVCNYDQPNQLFLNLGLKDGQLRFEERAKNFGLDLVDASWMGSFCDYDRDGDLDLYLQTYAYYREGGRPNFQIPTVEENGRTELAPEWRKYYRLRPVPNGPPMLEETGRPDRLLRNDGTNGQISFRDVTAASGLGQEPERGYSSVWWDYDRDGWMDLYVANDLDEPDRLYRNLGGKFQDVSAAALPHISWFSMGSAAADINNDGLLDLFAVDMAGTSHFKQKITMGAMNENAILTVAGPPPQIMRNSLLINSGVGRFLEGAYLAGLAETDWSWTPKFGDYDLDGQIDLYVTNGVVRDILNSDRPAPKGEQLFGKTDWDFVENQPERREQNLAYRNRGDLAFEDVSKAWGLDLVGMSYSAAAGDLDRDGDLDLVVANAEAAVSIYRNQGQAKGRAILRLHAAGQNTYGVGATVEARAGDARQTRQLQPAMGYLSSDESLLHFGFAEAKTFDVAIRWPSGQEQRLANLAVGHEHVITEQAASKPGAAPTAATQFMADSVLKGSGGMERAFDDFKIQPLLPNKLSNLGPGVACADVDGNGQEDLYFSRPAGVPGALLPNHTKPGAATLTFSGALPPAFAPDAACEDMAPLFFDADGDGDQDLFVVSGSVEWQPGAEAYRDRLYLNHTAPGTASTFIKAAPETLPDLRDSGSVAAAADADRDGDLDLFVGSRVIPGQFPLPATSRLLLNDGRGHFSDATAQLAPALIDTGLVTSALWSDADNDGWIDLLITHEWGPVKYLRNEQGKFTDATERAGLHQWKGWWNGIAGRDADNDGDMDFAVSNFGLNTKYHASADHPVVIFYGDLDGSGQANIIEAEYEGAQVFPVRGRSCSSRAMPSLANKFTSYQAFAQATLEQIYTPERLQGAKRFEANTLESGLLRNDGRGRFTFEPFPRLAQIAPSFGIVLTELDGDGWADCVIAQNFFSPQLETGRMDGGLSLLLRGVGQGRFEPVSASASGLAITGDAKGLAVSDLNADGWPDLVFGVNNGDPQVMVNRGSSIHQALALRLVGKPGNPTAIGARVTVELADGGKQTAEVAAGGGYLSQSSATLFFGLPKGNAAKEITVRWPDGSTSKATPSKERPFVMRQ